MIFSITFQVKSDHDVLLPPFTSKLSRSILAKISPTYAKIMESEEPFKPVRVTVIKDIDGSPVLALGNKKAVMKGGEVYKFSFSFLYSDIFDEILRNGGEVKIELWNVNFSAQIEDVKVVEEIEYYDSRFYYIKFITPTLLQPPRPPFKRKRNRFVLFPYSPLLLLSIARHWNKYMDHKIVGISGSKALYYFREVSYGLKPITTYYDGKPVRGFQGWIIFEITAKRNTKIRDNIQKLLNYANFFGVGKSRAIGFGEILARPISSNN